MGSPRKLLLFLPWLCTGFIASVMVLCSELLGEREIIFPEIAALAVGYLVAPKRSWHVNSLRMFLLISGCAWLGVLIVRYLPLGPLPGILLAFAFAQILFMYSGTTFAPFVSAIVLPVMLRTTSFVYPIAAMALTLAIILFHHLFLRMGLRSDEEYKPVLLCSRSDWLDTLLRVALVCVIGWAAFRVNMKYIIAPPLLVAFTEFSRPRNKTRSKPVKAVAVLTGCALAGSACRALFCMLLGWPLTVAACSTIVLVLLIVRGTKMYMPPAGAIAILSMLIPEEAVLLFPLQILLGSACIMVLSRLLFMRRQEKTDHELKTE